MATLYVLSWFHRLPRSSPRDTGWGGALQAYASRHQADVATRQRIELAQEMAGHGEREGQRVHDLRASRVELVAYELVTAPSLELLAAVISSPPRGDALHLGPDPLGQSGSWWTEARMITAWWGGLEVREDPERS